MKLLFLVDQVDYPFAPNPVLARRTAGQLAAMGHMVHLLELYDGQTLPPDPPEGCRFINRCRFASERCRKERPELLEMEPGHLVACHCCEEMKKGQI